MSETSPTRITPEQDEIELTGFATRGMRREDIDLASLNLPFADPPPPPTRMLNLR